MGTTEAEADLFYHRLAEASARAAEDGYLAENEPWMAAAFWR